MAKGVEGSVASSLGLQLFCFLISCPRPGLSSAAADPAPGEADPEQNRNCTNLKGPRCLPCLEELVLQRREPTRAGQRGFWPW